MTKIERRKPSVPERVFRLATTIALALTGAACSPGGGSYDTSHHSNPAIVTSGSHIENYADYSYRKISEVKVGDTIIITAVVNKRVGHRLSADSIGQTEPGREVKVKAVVDHDNYRWVSVDDNGDLYWFAAYDFGNGAEHAEFPETRIIREAAAAANNQQLAESVQATQSATSNESSHNPESNSNQKTVITNGLNIRSCPSTACAQVGQYNFGDTFVATGKTESAEGYIWIEVNNGTWVASGLGNERWVK